MFNTNDSTCFSFKINAFLTVKNYNINFIWENYKLKTIWHRIEINEGCQFSILVAINQNPAWQHPEKIRIKLSESFFKFIKTLCLPSKLAKN